MTQPVGIRLNNPGNIKHGAAQWRGASDVQKNRTFVTFKSPEWGIRAIAVIIRVYAGKQARNGTSIDTIEEIITRWAPPIENNTNAYISYVDSQHPKTAFEKIDADNYDDIEPLVKAIIHFENGRIPYSQDIIDHGLMLAGIQKKERTDMADKIIPPKKPVILKSEINTNTWKPERKWFASGAGGVIALLLVSAVEDFGNVDVAGKWEVIIVMLSMLVTHFFVPTSVQDVISRITDQVLSILEKEAQEKPLPDNPPIEDPNPPTEGFSDSNPGNGGKGSYTGPLRVLFMACCLTLVGCQGFNPIPLTPEEKVLAETPRARYVKLDIEVQELYDTIGHLVKLGVLKGEDAAKVGELVRMLSVRMDEAAKAVQVPTPDPIYSRTLLQLANAALTEIILLLQKYEAQK